MVRGDCIPPTRGGTLAAQVLTWSLNYAPELTGIPPLVTDAAERLAQRGNDVDTVAPVANYPERVIRPEFRGSIWSSETRNGVRVHRYWVRVRPQESFLDEMLYEVSSALAWVEDARPAPEIGQGCAS